MKVQQGIGRQWRMTVKPPMPKILVNGNHYSRQSLQSAWKNRPNRRHPTKFGTVFVDRLIVWYNNNNNRRLRNSGAFCLPRFYLWSNRNAVVLCLSWHCRVCESPKMGNTCLDATWCCNFDGEPVTITILQTLWYPPFSKLTIVMVAKFKQLLLEPVTIINHKPLDFWAPSKTPMDPVHNPLVWYQ